MAPPYVLLDKLTPLEVIVVIDITEEQNEWSSRVLIYHCFLVQRTDIFPFFVDIAG